MQYIPSAAGMSGNGSPVGLVVPAFKGVIYTDNTSPAVWQATGLLNSDWLQVSSGTGDVLSVFGRSGAVVATAGDYTVSEVTGAAAASSVPAAATTVTGPDAFGAVSAVGVGTEYARNDHNHGLPAAPSSALTYVESYITASQNITTTPSNITSISLAAGTWLISGRASLSSPPASTNYIDLFIGPTSASSVGAYADCTMVFGNVTGGNGYPTLMLTKVVVLSVTTTVYLEMQGSVAVTGGIGFSGANFSASNITGITAVKIA